MNEEDDGFELSASVGDAPDERFPNLHQPRERTGFEELNLNSFLVEDQFAAYGGLARGVNRKLQRLGRRPTILLWVVAVMVLVVASIAFVV